MGKAFAAQAMLRVHDGNVELSDVSGRYRVYVVGNTKNQGAT
jgi:hypothetical protein